MNPGDVDFNWPTDTTCPGYVAVLAVHLLSPYDPPGSLHHLAILASGTKGHVTGKNAFWELPPWCPVVYCGQRASAQGDNATATTHLEGPETLVPGPLG